jgi:hypothetical protein
MEMLDHLQEVLTFRRRIQNNKEYMVPTQRFVAKSLQATQAVPQPR